MSGGFYHNHSSFEMWEGPKVSTISVHYFQSQWAFCVYLLLHCKLNFRLLYFFCFNFRTRSPDGKSHLVNSSSSGRLSPFPQEDLSSVGFVEEPDLVDLCDMSGHIWVHERCAAWTLASIATKSSADYTVDLTNQILSKVNSSSLLFVMSVNCNCFWETERK